MHPFFKKYTTKPTLVSILGPLFIIVGLPIGLNWLTLDGGGSLGGALVLMAVFYSFIFVNIDRYLVKTISHKLLNILEILLFLAFSSMYLYSVRKIKIFNSETNYIVIIENNGKFTNSPMSYSFPFDKKMELNDCYGVVDSLEEAFQKIDLQSLDNWEGYTMRRWEYEEYKLLFFYNQSSQYSNPQIDSLSGIVIQKAEK